MANPYGSIYTGVNPYAGFYQPGKGAFKTSSDDLEAGDEIKLNSFDASEGAWDVTIKGIDYRMVLEIVPTGESKKELQARHKGRKMMEAHKSMMKEINVEELWYNYDTDRSGTMDPAEMQAVLVDICKAVEKIDRTKIETLGKNLPDNAQSAAVYQALVNAHLQITDLIASRCSADGVEFAMYLFDKDGDGQVSKDEFCEKAKEVLFGEESTLISSEEMDEITEACFSQALQGMYGSENMEAINVISEALQNVMGSFQPDEETLNNIWTKYDEDESGDLDVEEAKKLCVDVITYEYENAMENAYEVAADNEYQNELQGVIVNAAKEKYKRIYERCNDEGVADLLACLNPNGGPVTKDNFMTNANRFIFGPECPLINDEEMAEIDGMAMEEVRARLEDMAEEMWDFQTMIEEQDAQIAKEEEQEDPINKIFAAHTQLLSRVSMEDVWNNYDTDGNGKLDKAELKGMLKDIVVAMDDMGNEAIEQAKASLPEDTKSQAVIQALITAYVNISRTIRERADTDAADYAMFKFDVDKDGTIDKAEFLSRAKEVLFGADCALITDDELLKIEEQMGTDMLTGVFQLEGLESAEAMLVAIEQAMENITPPADYLNTIWDSYDADKSGTLEAEEVTNLLMDVFKFTETSTWELTETVKGFDPWQQQMQNIVLQAAEFRFELIEERINPENAAKVIALFDKNGDGQLDKAEFLAKANTLIFGKKSPLLTEDEEKEIQNFLLVNLHVALESMSESFFKFADDFMVPPPPPPPATPYYDEALAFEGPPCAATMGLPCNYDEDNVCTQCGESYEADEAIEIEQDPMGATQELCPGTMGFAHEYESGVCKFCGAKEDGGEEESVKEEAKIEEESAAPAADEPWMTWGEVDEGNANNRDDFKYKVYKELPPMVTTSNGGKHKSLMANKLTPEIFAALKDVKTSKGYTLSHAIQTGVMTPHLGVGITAGDEESWEVFKDIYYPIINGWHGYDPATQVHVSDLNPENLNMDEAAVELFNKYVVSTRIRAARNISGFALPAGSSAEDRKGVRDTLEKAFGKFEGDLKGTFYDLGALNDEQSTFLRDNGFLFQKPKPTNLLTYCGAARDWPDNRGIFHNDSHTALAWCNEEDHCRIISMSKDGNVKGVFARFAAISDAIKSSVESDGGKFMFSEKLGFLGTCPSNLGTGLRASVMVRLPELNKDVHLLEEICESFNLQPRGSDGEHSAAVGAKWDISNKQRIGFTEVELVQKMINGVGKLIALEEKLGRGEALVKGVDYGSEEGAAAPAAEEPAAE